MTPAYSVAELMATAIAREMRDDDFAAIGTASEIPLCAIRLAQKTHAPNMWFIYGGCGALNSKNPKLVEMAADFRNMTGAEYRAPLADLIDFEFTGRFSVLCFGGMQIDRYGNVNITNVGEYANPKVRGPGTIGLPFMASVKRTILYVQHHHARLFVPKVDFISGPGHLQDPELAQYRRPWAIGTTLVVTPLAILDFETPDRRMRLKSVHPGQTAQSVQAATGFELAIDGDVPATEVPTLEQLKIIREEIDTTGVLQRLIV
jgi:glutaconate CoA-transferase subunit B